MVGSIMSLGLQRSLTTQPRDGRPVPFSKIGRRSGRVLKDSAGNARSEYVALRNAGASPGCRDQDDSSLDFTHERVPPRLGPAPALANATAAKPAIAIPPAQPMTDRDQAIFSTKPPPTNAPTPANITALRHTLSGARTIQISWIQEPSCAALGLGLGASSASTLLASAISRPVARAGNPHCEQRYKPPSHPVPQIRHCHR